MKQIEDFKKAAKERNISHWDIHECSMCRYECGFIIRGEEVYYDSGCKCTMGPLRQSNWEELAEFYNNNAGASDVEERMKKYPDFKKSVEEDNEFWGFN